MVVKSGYSGTLSGVSGVVGISANWPGGRDGGEVVVAGLSGWND